MGGYGGEGGIRTRDTSRYTRFPSERTRPTMRPLHVSAYYIRDSAENGKLFSGKMDK